MPGSSAFRTHFRTWMEENMKRHPSTVCCAREKNATQEDTRVNLTICVRSSWQIRAVATFSPYVCFLVQKAWFGLKSFKNVDSLLHRSQPFSLFPWASLGKERLSAGKYERCSNQMKPLLVDSAKFRNCFIGATTILAISILVLCKVEQTSQICSPKKISLLGRTPRVLFAQKLCCGKNPMRQSQIDHLVSTC